MSSNAVESSTADEGPQEQAGEPTMLVSEFPPPPFYYTRADSLEPPEIPTSALECGTRRAAAAAARARAEAERQRLGDEIDKTGAIFGGAIKDEEEQGDVVAVFGEIVEDPVLIEPLDYCEDPQIVRDEVKRLNATVLKEFVRLVQDLVHRPLEHKITRDSLSHNIFLMLQECNKFREHQAREILIELLEEQLAARKELLKELQENIDKADALLD